MKQDAYCPEARRLYGAEGPYETGGGWTAICIDCMRIMGRRMGRS